MLNYIIISLATHSITGSHPHDDQTKMKTEQKRKHNFFKVLIYTYDAFLYYLHTTNRNGKKPSDAYIQIEQIDKKKKISEILHIELSRGYYTHHQNAHIYVVFVFY